MCDWGGGPNEMANYLRDVPPRKRTYRTIKCMVYMGNNKNCDLPIENFTMESLTYWEWDEQVQKHLKEVHPNHHMIRRE